MILVLIFMTIGKGDIAIVCASPLELKKFLLKIDVYLSFAISSCLPVASSGVVSSGTGGTFGR